MRLIWEKQSSEYLMKIHQRYRQTIAETTQEKVAWKPGWCFCLYTCTHCLRGKETVLSVCFLCTYKNENKTYSLRSAAGLTFHKLSYNPCMKSC